MFHLNWKKNNFRDCSNICSSSSGLRTYKYVLRDSGHMITRMHQTTMNYNHRIFFNATILFLCLNFTYLERNIWRKNNIILSFGRIKTHAQWFKIVVHKLLLQSTHIYRQKKCFISIERKIIFETVAIYVLHLRDSGHINMSSGTLDIW